MKKRIKLTDKELAIGMWAYICLYIESYDSKFGEHKYICSLKRRWLEKHDKVNKYWLDNCWLCTKYWHYGCGDCPLRSCRGGSLYDRVTDYYLSKDFQIEALRCAKTILSVIQEAEDEDN